MICSVRVNRCAIQIDGQTSENARRMRSLSLMYCSATKYIIYRFLSLQTSFSSPKKVVTNAHLYSLKIAHLYSLKIAQNFKAVQTFSFLMCIVSRYFCLRVHKFFCLISNGTNQAPVIRSQGLAKGRRAGRTATTYTILRNETKRNQAR